jgi:hypothetical protein
MEVTLGCGTATVAILDNNFQEVVVFPNQPVSGTGAMTYCMDSGGFDRRFRNPGFGDRTDMQ